MNIKKIIHHKTLIIITLLTSINYNAYSLKIDNITRKKADFITDIASLIKYPDSPNSKTYKLGFYGKDRKIRELIKEFILREKKLIIQGKPVEILHFKRSKDVQPIDLLYVSGDSKIRISDLNHKLSNYPYILLTENFPYGTSSLNFSTNKNDDIFFEIQEEALISKGAIVHKDLLSSQKRITSLNEWKLKLKAALTQIEKQGVTIDQKTAEIRGNKRVISSLRFVIIFTLSVLFIISALGIMLYKSNLERKIALKEITDSMHYAKYIQNALLPPISLFQKTFKDSFVLFQPRDIVSGDFYWIEKANGKIFFTVADCTGHGVPGSLLSVMCNNALNKAVKELNIYTPAKILDKTVEILEYGFSKSENDVLEGMDLALCAINLKDKKLEYAGAKTPLYLLQKGELKRIKADRLSIGKYSERTPYTNHSFDLNEGDCIYITSDGYIDQFGGDNNKKFSFKRFKEALLSIHTKPMEQQKEILNKNLKEWKGKADQIDDITILGIRL